MIIDLHCDLLLYLQQNQNRTPFDPTSRCSIPQMRQGNVKAQVLAIYTPTCEESVGWGIRQNDIFHSLMHQYPNDYQNLNSSALSYPTDKISVIRAIENASAFCSETEPLEAGLKRLDILLKQGPLAYISLTWNTENRFGGGAHTTKGLANDGKSLLTFMSNKRVAVDLSHASDSLAFDILDYIDQNKLLIPVIASHSNCRAVWNGRRNLPDALISEITQREGLIGINFIKSFLGKADPRSFSKHLKHLLTLGCENNICFGADFLCENDIPPSMRLPQGEYFFEGFDNASTYQRVIQMWAEDLGITSEQIQKIQSANSANFLIRNIL